MITKVSVEAGSKRLDKLGNVSNSDVKVVNKRSVYMELH